MRMPRPGAAALSNAPMPYTTRPTVKQRLRPQRSVSLPPGIINAAMTSRKMVIATWMPWTVVSRSWLMSLIITFMLVPAKLQMNCASASGTSTARNALDGRPAVLSSVTSHQPPRTRMPPRPRDDRETVHAAQGVGVGVLILPCSWRRGQATRSRRQLDYPHPARHATAAMHQGGRGVGTHDLV